MRNKCLFALGLVFAMSLTSIVAFAFSFTGEPDVKNDQKQIVVVNPATESEETTSEQTVSAETEDTTTTLQMIFFMMIRGFLPSWLKSRNSKSHRLSLAEQIPYILPLSSMGRKLMQSTFPSTRIL